MFPAFSLPSLLAQTPGAPDAEKVKAMFQDLGQRLRGDEVPLLAFVVLAVLVVPLLAYWLASLACAGERASFGKALGVYFLYLLLGAVGGVALGLGAAFLSTALQSYQAAHGAISGALTLGFGMVLLLVVVLLLWGLFYIPMRLYRIGFGAALGFVLLSMVLSGFGNYGLQRGFGDLLARKQAIVVEWAREQKLSPPGLAGAGAFPLSPEAFFTDAEQRAANPGLSLEERHTALKQLHDRLETVCTELKPGDATARAEYERHKARYESLLNSLRAEVAAQGRAGARGAP